jgi:hypothetical protein
VGGKVLPNPLFLRSGIQSDYLVWLNKMSRGRRSLHNLLDHLFDHPTPPPRNTNVHRFPGRLFPIQLQSAGVYPTTGNKFPENAGNRQLIVLLLPIRLPAWSLVSRCSDKINEFLLVDLSYMD